MFPGVWRKYRKSFATNSLPDRGVWFRARKGAKKSPEIIWKSREKGVIFAPASAKESTRNTFWKIFKKVPKSFGDSEIWLTFAPLLNDEGHSERQEKRFWKISEKNLEKDLVVQNFRLNFAPLSARKNRRSERGHGLRLRPDKKKEIVLYSNITEQRSLKYLSS